MNNAASTFSQFITSTKDQLLGRVPYNPEGGKALLVSVNVSFTDYGYDTTGNNRIHEELDDRRSLVFLFTGNTTVWVATIRDQAFFFPASDSKNTIPLFEHKSDHDSAWRSVVSDHLSDNFYEMFENVTANRVEAGETVSYKDYSPFLWDFKFALGTVKFKRNGDHGSIVTDFTPDD